MFEKHNLQFQENLFQILSRVIEFEQFSRDRLGAILVSPGSSIPIVRTTAIYNKPSQLFSPVHNEIMEKIKVATGNIDIKFNNAMVEIYDPTYTSMRYHSDAALDLVSGSYICLFSVYENKDEEDLKKLKIKDKETGTETELTLEHNSIVLFSIETNGKFLHKIVSDSHKRTKSRWLGVTFRLSRTFIKRENGSFVLENGRPLSIANEQEKKEFYKHKRLENVQVGYKYPSSEIFYTLSNH
jgi:hypothetical protein